MPVEAIPHGDLTYRIIGCAMRVHNRLGPGLREAAYQQALSISMEEENLSFETERRVPVMFDGATVGVLYIDHLVQDSVVVEEKGLSHQLTDEEVAQVITYLAATGYPVGLLLNFGRGRLEHRRILRPRKLDEWQQRIRRYTRAPS